MGTGPHADPDGLNALSVAQLRVVYAVADRLSFIAVADDQGLTQPAGRRGGAATRIALFHQVHRSMSPRPDTAGVLQAI